MYCVFTSFSLAMYLPYLETRRDCTLVLYTRNDLQQFLDFTLSFFNSELSHPKFPTEAKEIH